jgi:hypothetical protein
MANGLLPTSRHLVANPGGGERFDIAKHHGVTR